MGGQYVFDIEVGKYKNFLNWDDLIEFTVFEEAGCVLPYFDLIFKFQIADIRNYLVENNPLKITLGSNRMDMKTIPLRIYQKTISKHGQGYWTAKIHGFYDAVPFLNETGTSSIKGTSLVAMKSVISKYFTFETNISSTDDYQTWLRCKKTARDFATDIWLHSHLANSFTGVAITKDGKFIFNDMVKSMNGSSKWTFTYQPSGKSNEVLISGQPDVLNDTGLVNIFTQSKKNIIYNMDDGSKKEYVFERKPILATTTNLEQTDIAVKDSSNYWQNSNVHNNYWTSYSNNLGMLTFFSGARVVVSYIGHLVDQMEVLDIANILDMNPQNKHETEGLYSGKYIISKIVRTIGHDRNLQTHVILSREALNDVRDVEKDSKRVMDNNIVTNTDYTKATVKLRAIQSLMKSGFSLNNFNLVLPNIRILSPDLNSLYNTYESTYENMFNTYSTFKNSYKEVGSYFNNPSIGFNQEGIWLSMDYILGSSEAVVLEELLKVVFELFTTTSQCKSLTSTSSIITELNSGNYSSYISNNVINIPNVGSTSIVPSSYTASVFSWYLSGKITDSGTNTGNKDLDNLLSKTVSYLKSSGVVGTQFGSTFKRYWGCSSKSTLNSDDLYSFYSGDSNSLYFNKIVPSKNGYIYFMYPTYMGACNIKINNTVYTNYEVKTQSFKVNNNKNIDYFVFRTKDKFNSNTYLEVSDAS